MFVTVVLCLVAAAVAFLVWHALSNKLDRRYCTSKRSLAGKTAVITGGSAGIGKETAKDFARRGARVILACRNLEKGQNVADEIIAQTGNPKVVVRRLDTSDLQSVRDCARDILSKEKRLDILVNNAGMGGNDKIIVTRERFEETMATNYFGHFLLTNLLLDLILKSDSGRIVNLSSQLHRLCFSLDPNNLNFEKTWLKSALFKYAQSKACVNLFTLELARRLKEKKSGVTVNALHPGIVATEIFAKSKVSISYLMDLAANYLANSVEIGAQTSIHVAVSEEVENVSGKYFDNCQECTPSGLSLNKDLARKLWDASVRDVGLKNTEIAI